MTTFWLSLHLKSSSGSRVLNVPGRRQIGTEHFWSRGFGCRWLVHVCLTHEQ
ncbi:hypothetical protein M2253_002114 [Leucobacter luti]|nr:hypothetical protein [Leucobacter luti]